MEYWFDERDAARYVRFIEGFLTHDHGRLAGHPFLLEPWQKNIVLAVFGWKQPDGLRKFRKVFIFVPSGNGKSMLISAILVAMLFIGQEPRAEIYNAASDREQAKIIFETSKHMVESNPALLRRVEIFTNSIVLKKDGSFYRVLSGSPGGKHGKRTQALGVDELHELPDRELIDGLGGTLGKRSQPLDLRASTAGYDKTSVCWAEYDYAKKVLATPDKDPRYLPVLYEPGPGDDWKSEDTWRKVNPNWGSAVNPEFIRTEFAKATEIAYEENAFRRLHTNEWQEQDIRWMSVAKWDACHALVNGLRPAPGSGQPSPLEFYRALAGRKAYGALDLGSTDDLSALALDFPPGATGQVANPEAARSAEGRNFPPGATGQVANPEAARSAEGRNFPPASTPTGTPLPADTGGALPHAPPAPSSIVMRYWMPEDNVVARTRRSGIPYSTWSRACHCHRGGDPLACTALIHLTPGPVTDYDFILRDILAIHSVTPITELAIDPHLFAKLYNDLTNNGLNAFKHLQGFISMGFACKELERALLGKMLVHADDPVTRWQLGNIVASFDPAGNMKFNKKKASEKIDGWVALAMAAGRAALNLSNTNVVRGAVLL